MDSFAIREAERFLKEWDVASLPIKPLEIAEKTGILCQGMPSKNGGVSGMFVRKGDVYGILYATHVNNKGFQNYSIGHELGHYFLPGHPEAVFSTHDIHESRAGFVSDNKYEIEADDFACGLLMPNYLFDPAIEKTGEGLEAIKSLASLCGTSLTATAIRYAQRSPEPVAIVVTIGNKVDYCFMSDGLKEYPGLTWIKKGSNVPSGSVAYTFNQNSDNVLQAKEEPGEVDLATWFGGEIEGELYEEVIGLGSYGKTLSVLTGSDLPDPEDIEEEKELVESWTPRFRR